MCKTETPTPSPPSTGPAAGTPVCGPTPCPMVHAAVAVKQVTFAGNHPVEKDTLGNFVAPEWKEGRVQADQAPVCYTRNRTIRLSAVFRVTRQPTATETVALRGKATFGSATLRWTGNVTVNPGDTEVTLPMTTSDAPLPDQVDCFEGSSITWEMNPAGTGWAGAGATLNVVYVTLADPSGTPAYWTLLDISCRAARGDKTEAALVPHVFVPFTGRSLKRKRDGHALTYWNPDTTTVTNCRDLLAAADGSGQCGSWAHFLIDMLKVHGITGADKILIVRTIPEWRNSTTLFLVKNWTFRHPPPSAPSAYTHTLGTQCVKAAGIPGQGNPNPPPAFYNHFIVRHGGRFYDPSYGAGPFSDQLAWEKAAIDGLSDGSQAGYDKSLNATTKLLEFYDLTTSTKI